MNTTKSQLGYLAGADSYALVINKHLNLEYNDDPASSIPPHLAEVYALLKQGKKMEAIRAYRQQTGAGVDEAMVAVEKLGLSLTKG